MSTIIIYYSMNGNTDLAAHAIAEKLGAELLRLVPVKKYPDKGFKKFLWGGKSAMMAETPELEPYSFDSEKYDRIIIGFPVWASNITPPIRTFVRDNDISQKKVAAFACQTATGAEKAFFRLVQAIGIPNLEASLVLIDPKDKPDPGNDSKIEAFCERLQENAD